MLQTIKQNDGKGNTALNQRINRIFDTTTNISFNNSQPEPVATPVAQAAPVTPAAPVAPSAPASTPGAQS
jgi:hypothetical protein